MPISQAKKLEIITKHGRKFTLKSASTPVLEGVYYAADGSAVATDRHKLLRIKDVHAYTQPFTSHAVTGAPIDGTYPDVSKIIPTEFKAEIALITGYNQDGLKDAIARVKLAVDVAKMAGDKSFVATLIKAGDIVTLSVHNDSQVVSYTVGISADTSGEDITVAFNAEYLLAALNVFKDAGSARVRIGLTGAISPILLTDEDSGIEALILPYRIPAKAQ